MLAAGEVMVPVTTEIGSVRAFMSQCAEDGIDLATEMGAEVLRIWLQSPTDEICKCRSRLRTFERLNGKCERCVDYQLRRLAEVTAGTVSWAR